MLSINENWVYHKLVLFNLLFWFYALKFSGQLGFDTVFFGYLSILLYSFGFFLNPRGFILNFSGFQYLYIAIAMLIAGVAVNYFAYSSDISFLRFFFVAVVVFIYFLIPVGERSNLFFYKFFVFLSTIFIASMVIFLSYTGSHYRIFLSEEFLNNYLILSDLLAIMALLIIATNLNILLRVLILFLLILGVFYLGSRSAMVFLLVAAGVALFFEFRILSFRYKVIFILSFFVTTFFVVDFIFENQQRFYRLFSLFELEDDHSAQGRNLLFMALWDSLSQDLGAFVFGGGVLTPGSYVHNIFSLWQLFGLPVFFVLNILFLYSLFIMISNPVHFKKIFPLWIFCFLSLLFTRSPVGIVFPVLFALSWLIVFKFKSKVFY